MGILNSLMHKHDNITGSSIQESRLTAFTAVDVPLDEPNWIDSEMQVNKVSDERLRMSKYG